VILKVDKTKRLGDDTLQEDPWNVALQAAVAAAAIGIARERRVFARLPYGRVDHLAAFDRDAIRFEDWLLGHVILLFDRLTFRFCGEGSSLPVRGEGRPGRVVRR
jgi:hypothetical protein